MLTPPGAGRCLSVGNCKALITPVSITSVGIPSKVTGTKSACDNWEAGNFFVTEHTILGVDVF
jgi:hypothetical protein